MSNTYTNNLALTRYLAAQIYTMTGITTYADNQTDSIDGLFSSCLLLTCVNTQEIIENNNTQRISYSLSYITQPEQETQAAINTTLETIY